MTLVPHSGPTWSDRVDQFCIHLEEEEKSAHTRRSYRDTLHAFAAWHREHHGGDEPEVSRVAKRDALDWKEHIERRGRQDDRGDFRPAAPATVNRKLSSLRTFIRWAKDRGLCDPRLEAPKPRRKHGRPKPKSLEPDERKALIKAAERRESPRDILLVRLGLEAGLRVAEMAALKWSHVKVGDRKGSIVVRGKGDKERSIDLTKSLRHAFLEHRYERNRGRDRPVLENAHGGGLSVRGIQDIVARLAAVARVGKRVGLEGCTVHTLRHTCADWLLNEQGLSVPEVAEVLGHQDIKTTQIYLVPHRGRLADRMAAIEG